MLTFVFFAGLLVGALVGHKFPQFFEWFFKIVRGARKAIFKQ